MTSHPIEFDKLTVYYGALKALDTLSLNVREGSIHALLGRNGAGKTTALRCLLGLLEPTRGSVRILGHAAASMPPTLRNRIGYVSEGQKLVGWMKVNDIVAFQRATFDTFDDDLCARYLKRLNLPRDRRVHKLSRGMRAQLALALALAPHPEVVVMDDPGMGLDAVVRREFLEVMIDLIQEEGRTLLFTSHILHDVERMCDTISIIHAGTLRVNAELDTVKERIRRWRLVFDGDAPAPPEGLPGLVRARRRRNELLLTVVDGDAGVPAAATRLGAASCEPERLSLEDLFIEYTAEGVAAGRPAPGDEAA